MDRITKSLLDEFCREHGLTLLPEDKQFEHFSAYLTLSRFLSESFDTSELVTGASGDTSLDAIGIVVNGALVTEREAVEDLAARNGYLEVVFVFVQAERSASFETAKIGQIGFGVNDFFSEDHQLPRNELVSEAAAITAAIYERSPRFTRGNPSCRIFYITTGKWLGDQNLEARRAGVVADLKGLNIFKTVEFTPVGADLVQKWYHEAKNATSCDFDFRDRIAMPTIPGVSEAHLGIIPGPEFLRLIQDESGSLIRSIFYDNVRDWQDYNTVNEGIRDTVASDLLRPRFALMNNGITIIAKSLRATGTRFHVEDYQIVNGCQTSHVLYDHRNAIDESVMVPVRLIATQDEDVIASIIKATNRQTEVKEEQLLALSDFQKKLEAYFQTFENGKKLYYERRSRQYNSVPGIEKTRIVTLGNLVRAFASIFLQEPHRTARNYGALLDRVGKEIFGDSHRLEPYYVAALAQYKLEFLFRNGFINAEYKPARYHMLLAFRFLTSDPKLPAANSHEMERYCKPIVEGLWDASKAEEIFKNAANVVSSAAGGNLDRDNIRTSAFTELLIEFFQKKVKKPS